MGWTTIYRRQIYWLSVALFTVTFWTCAAFAMHMLATLLRRWLL